jgi:hypothetical protein
MELIADVCKLGIVEANAELDCNQYFTELSEYPANSRSPFAKIVVGFPALVKVLTDDLSLIRHIWSALP